MKNNMDSLIQSLSKWSIFLSEKQLQQFDDYYELIKEWNSVMNLTTITELQEVIDKHFVDSIALAQYRKFSNETVIDVGTGAGFPGIPLKIVFPEIDIVLMDSLNKRINFLNTVISKLDLTKTIAIHNRAENLAHNNEYREKFDVCVSRAVANLSTLSEYCIPFIKQNGYFISYKTINAKDEIVDSEKAINALGGKIRFMKEYTLPETNIERILVYIEKCKKTNNIYPRKAGTPSKEPIK